MWKCRLIVHSKSPGGIGRNSACRPSYKGKNLWLHFNGINYRANVWLNGVQIADEGKMVGNVAAV